MKKGYRANSLIVSFNLEGGLGQIAIKATVGGLDDVASLYFKQLAANGGNPNDIDPNTGLKNSYTRKQNVQSGEM